MQAFGASSAQGRQRGASLPRQPRQATGHLLGGAPNLDDRCGQAAPATGGIDPVREPAAPRSWPTLCGDTVDVPQVSEALLERVRRVYSSQAGDEVRFGQEAPDLFAQLDPSVGVLVAMSCDHRFARLFENWAASCVWHGIDVRSSTIVFPTDRQAQERIERLGFLTYFDQDSELLFGMRESGAYGDLAWTAYMYHQNWVIRQLLNAPADLLFQDADLVWRRDPRPVLIERARAGADVQAMYDGPNGRFRPLFANSGFMYLRRTPAVREFWNDVYGHHEMVGHFRSQQQAMNIVLAYHAQRGLDTLILDEDRFTNGHRYCGGRTPPADPWVVHNSWTRDLDEKLRRYFANGLWYLSPGTRTQPVQAE
jgi:hypothetical protein